MPVSSLLRHLAPPTQKSSIIHYRKSNHPSSSHMQTTTGTFPRRTHLSSLMPSSSPTYLPLLSSPRIRYPARIGRTIPSKTRLASRSGLRSFLPLILTDTGPTRRPSRKAGKSLFLERSMVVMILGEWKVFRMLLGGCLGFIEDRSRRCIISCMFVSNTSTKSRTLIFGLVIIFRTPLL